MINSFEIFKKLNLDDTANSSRNLAMSNTLLSLNKVSGGFEIKMGVSHEAGMDVFTDKSFAVALIINRDEYAKVKHQFESLPVKKTSGKNHYILMQHDHYVPKNNLHKEVRERVKTEFCNRLTGDIAVTVDAIYKAIVELNFKYSRCKPVKADYYSDLKLFDNPQLRVDGLFTVTFYEVKEVSNA
ncbi:hypothetical protein [Mongoliitalea lutea]|uniref:Uncharacterized protein n=1 Tax=Mongoliitalea lutea TaxID=849756 RepID=A0A8J3CXJ4_9BACT|nr:hypothetical protein [Mongoliitalea lutea]GHB44588.1 hypothetical protein GCM10008106_27080 [Mongoliitalea lutea]